MTTPESSLSQHEGNIEKAFVNEQGQATLACPQCNIPKVVNVGHLRERQHQLKVKCSCQHIYRVRLDFRQCYRKPTKLTGTYSMFPPAGGGGLATIQNISLTGICFKVSGLHTLLPGQSGYIDFDLDNKKMTHLHKEFIVRKVSGNLIGCQFKQNPAFDKELGFYMRFGN